MREREKMFNTISSTYDWVNRILSLGQDLRWRKKIARFLPTTPISLLDLATGTADQLIVLCDLCPNITQAIGIDLAEDMLKIGQKKLRGKPYKAQLIKGDAERLPFLDESFDITTISFGIRNVHHVDKALKEMYRVLKPQGKSFILEFSLPSNQPVKQAHLFYIQKLLPKIGGFISKNPEAYTYLNKTIERFPYGEAFLKLMDKEGFKNLTATPFTFGSVTLYEGAKC